MNGPQLTSASTLTRDLIAGLVVFLVALPLCLGIALASGAPLFAGIISGIVGGILVGILSGSHTSVSGPAAGLTAVVAVQIATLGFPAFLLAVTIAGVIQICLGVLRAGFIAAFIPNSVIKGLLAAIGLILILKQIPHLIGHDPDPMGQIAFLQPDQQNTFSEIMLMIPGFQLGAAVIGFISLAILIIWDHIKFLKTSLVPAPLVVALLSFGLVLLFRDWGKPWMVEPTHLVQVPVAENFGALLKLVQFPDFSQWLNGGVYVAAITLALVASLETLLNLEAVDKLDPRKRQSPPSRELLAQGVGNVASGLLGGLPMTSVIVRSSVNIMAGGRTKLSAIIHGFLLLGSVLLLPTLLNTIPLSALAAILLTTGIKLANPALVRQMWNAGWNQFLPFAATVIAIVMTDLLIGILLGSIVSVGFILHSNLRRPLRRIMERHVGGEVLRIELANQVSFLNRATLSNTLAEVPAGGHVLLDARNTDYIDPDVLDLIRDFEREEAPARGVKVSLLGFRDQYRFEDRIQYVDYATREVQSALTPARVLEILKNGNERFLNGQQLIRDLSRLKDATAQAQYPMAVILTCIDSRTPAELIFDLGLGDIFTIRIAGNVAKEKVLGSMEFACKVAGAKLVLVMGHTSCGAVKAAVDLSIQHRSAADATGCEHLDALVTEIQHAIDPRDIGGAGVFDPRQRADFVDRVARRNVERTIDMIHQRSHTLEALVKTGQIAIVGAMYDLKTGDVDFFDEPRE